MHSTPSKRRELTQRVITYIFMTVAVIAAVAFCLFIALGYSVDQKTGRAERGGLLQFRSFPSGANVTIDETLQSFKTPNKATTSPGQHDVTVARNGYRSWQKHFKLDSGELLWLNSRLVPSSITTSEVWQFEQVHSTKASPDKKRYAVVENANKPVINIFDLTSQAKPRATQLKIPASVAKVTSLKDTFKIVEWDFSGRYLLIKHTSGPQTSWLRLDSDNPNNAVNITARLGLKLRQAHFAGSNGNLLYVLDGDNIARSIDLSDNSISSPIASGVREFDLYKDNQLVLVSQDKASQTLSVYKQGLQKPIVVRTYQGLQPQVHASLSSYFDDDYVAASYGNTVDIFKDPYHKNILLASLVFKTASPRWVFFSNNGQFVVAQSGAQLMSYDIERGTTFRFSVPAGANYNPSQHLQWLDDFRLWSDADGVVSVIDFDGTNLQRISRDQPGYSVTLSDDNKQLYSIGTNVETKQPILQSSALVVQN